MSIFSLITPVGIGIGIVVTESSNVEGSFVAILQALAAGTLVYVVFFEVLEKERVKKHNLGSKNQSWCQLYGVIQVNIIYVKKMQIKKDTLNCALKKFLFEFIIFLNVFVISIGFIYHFGVCNNDISSTT